MAEPGMLCAHGYDPPHCPYDDCCEKDALQLSTVWLVVMIPFIILFESFWWLRRQFTKSVGEV